MRGTRGLSLNKMILSLSLLLWPHLLWLRPSSSFLLLCTYFQILMPPPRSIQSFVLCFSPLFLFPPFKIMKGICCFSSHISSHCHFSWAWKTFAYLLCQTPEAHIATWQDTWNRTKCCSSISGTKPIVIKKNPC